jgi:hypothetical protein
MKGIIVAAGVLAIAAVAGCAHTPPPPEAQPRILIGQPTPPPQLPPPPAGAAVGVYKVCVDTSGTVTSVEPITPLGGDKDGGMMAAIRRWKARPQPIAVCSATRVVYEKTGAAAPAQ